MILGHGIDLVEVSRIEAMLARHGDRFLQRVFTVAERAHRAGTPSRALHLAARFAAKEAAFKALGTGWRSGIAWTDAEVVLEPSGRPTLRVSGEAARLAASLGIRSWQVSLTHTGAYAAASVIAEG